MTEPEPQTPLDRLKALPLGQIRMGTGQPTGGTPIPLARVREFLRQHRAMEGGDREAIAKVHHHSGRAPAPLNASDLQFLLDSMDRIRDLAYRAAGSGGDGELMGTIFHIASGVARGMPAPGFEGPLPIHVGPDGSVRGAGLAFDPFAAGGGERRTRTCVHCQRRCGDVPGGSGVVNDSPVCHPYETDRPNCYQLIVAHGHPVHSCERCNTFNRPLADVDHPASLLHIKEIRSHMNICGLGGAGVMSPAHATCPACRALYAANNNNADNGGADS